MKTKVLLSNEIDEAAEIFKNGGLIAFPTDTVYGLTAINTKKIYEVKNRPRDKHLIALFADMESTFVPEEYYDELNMFWPGALTIVYEGQACRVPACEIAREFIKKCGESIFAPSANLSGNAAPVNASEVLRDLDGKIDAVIDGGECEIGLPSTIFDLNNKRIIRQGKITKEELEKIFGENISD